MKLLKDSLVKRFDKEFDLQAAALSSPELKKSEMSVQLQEHIDFEQ
jgi:hypothetical protein